MYLVNNSTNYYWYGHPVFYSPYRGYSQLANNSGLSCLIRHRGVRPESIEVRRSSIRSILGIQQASNPHMCDIINY
jgi:hypothetical protein